MNSFAIYRLPYADSCTLVEQRSEPLVLYDLQQLNDRCGFVVAPFAVSRECPIVVISPDSVRQFQLDAKPMPSLSCHLADADISYTTENNSSSMEDVYATDFAHFHQALKSGRFQKLVLARCVAKKRQAHADPMRLFLSACQHYPRLFIAMVSTPQTGTWIVATPEVLLQQEGEQWRSIALAGTMQLTPDEMAGEGERRTWGEKDIREQRYVASFIAQELQRMGIPYEEQGPRTVRAAHLVHLRSDFVFRLGQSWSKRRGDLLAAFHPTPAVCGLPREEAQQFILHNEHVHRSYYSGFMGPLGIDMPTDSEVSSVTHLFVTLRCVQVCKSAYLMYAGGGILPDSLQQMEWMETEAKLYTMSRLIREDTEVS